MLSLEKIYSAYNALHGVVRKTDVIFAPKLRPGVDLFFKPENLQITGAFKLRGAYYKISTLSADERAHGVITCSAGNHAQGVAFAAQKNQIRAIICIPQNAPKNKIEATRSYGAEVCLVEGVYDDAYLRAKSLCEDMGYSFVHPFDDNEVIAGQGTVALEIINQLPDADAIVAPIGGGGLIAGVALAAKSILPRIKIYGVQSTGAPSMLNSIRENRIITLPHVSTVADGIAVKKPGRIAFDVCSRLVDDIALVSDDEICAAIFTLLKEYKIVAEGAGAAAVAAVMFDKFNLVGKRVVCIISGGNIDSDALIRAIDRGVAYFGK
ncbi:MAG: threonine ammonia-lyase [Clostridia bacterium]|nr:threonine ammonia-lyase [Clostridia bacterium]